MLRINRTSKKMKTRQKIILFFLFSFLFIGCDQVTKNLVKDNLEEGVSTSYLNDTFRLIYVQNTGAALGLGEDLHPHLSFWLLSIFPLIILSWLAYYAIRNAKKIGSIELLSFCLIIAGGIGNIIDRVLYDRHVTDFMNIGFGNVRTGIFNFADVCVTSGVIGLLYVRLTKSRSKSETDKTDQTDQTQFSS
jgi:signal peptidase II